MKLDYVVLYVNDLERTVGFYEAAFGLTRRFIHESGEYAEMETGTVTLGFATPSLINTLIPCGFTENSPQAPPPGMQISFTVEDVAQAYRQALAAGAMAVAPPELKPWGFLVAFVRDINGVLVEICKKM